MSDNYYHITSTTSNAIEISIMTRPTMMDLDEETAQHLTQDQEDDRSVPSTQAVSSSKTPQKVSTLNSDVYPTQDIALQHHNSSVKKFQGSTIKNVTGTGKDYVPFVGCDINALIANLNNSVSYHDDDDDYDNDNDDDSTSYDQSDWYMKNNNDHNNNHNNSNTPNAKDKHQSNEKSNSSMLRKGDSHNDSNSSIKSLTISPNSVVMTHDDHERLQQQNNKDHGQYQKSINAIEDDDEDNNSTIVTIGTNATLTCYQQQKQDELPLDHQTTGVRLFQDDDHLPKTENNKSKQTDQRSLSTDQWETIWSSEHDCPYYYNKSTGEVTWDNPNQRKIVYEDEYVPLVDFTKSNNDDIVSSNCSDIHEPSEDSIDHDSTSSSLIVSTTWERFWSDEHECEYFHNPSTGETRWDNPNSSESTKMEENQDDGKDDEFEADEVVAMSDFSSSTKKDVNVPEGSINQDGNNQSKDTGFSIIRYKLNSNIVEWVVETLRSIQVLLHLQNVDIDSDHPITSADLAYQRKVNLLNKRKQKRMKKRASIVMGFIMVVFMLNQLVKHAPSGTLSTDKNTLSTPIIHSESNKTDAFDRLSMPENDSLEEIISLKDDILSNDNDQLIGLENDLDELKHTGMQEEIRVDDDSEMNEVKTMDEITGSSINDKEEKQVSIFYSSETMQQVSKQNDKEETDLETDFTKLLPGAHFFDKFQCVIRTLEVALDVNLDLGDISDFPIDNKKALMAPEPHQSIEQNAYKLVMIVKESAPVVARKIIIDGTRAINEFKRSLVIIIKKQKSHAQTAIAHVLKKTKEFINILDYNRLVENGYISSSLPFQDTRTLHCQVPLLKNMNIRCPQIGADADKPVESVNWLLTRRRQIFANAEIISPSLQGGWSAPVWKTCSNGDCHSKVSITYDANRLSKMTNKVDGGFNENQSP